MTSTTELVLFSFVVVYAQLVLSDSIVFPGPTDKDDEAERKEIPLEMVLRLNTITDQNQLFREFIRDGSPVSIEPDAIQDRFGAENEPVERKALLTPKPAGCIPELRSVSLRQSDDPWLFYFPSCTRVERCGGCCSHKLLSCQPTDIETINYQVIVSHYKNGNQLTYKGTEVVTVEKHNKCKCDCIMKEKDCNPLQEYRKGECRCMCTNYDAEQKCTLDNETKLWNPDSCLCECRKSIECSTGYFFSQTSCQCEVIPDASVLRNRFGNLPFGGFPLDYNTQSPNVLRKWPPTYITDKK